MTNTNTKRLTDGTTVRLPDGSTARAYYDRSAADGTYYTIQPTVWGLRRDYGWRRDYLTAA